MQDLKYKKVDWFTHNRFYVFGLMAQLELEQSKSGGEPISFDDVVNKYEWAIHKGDVIPYYMYPALQRQAMKSNPQIKFTKIYTEKENTDEFEQFAGKQ